MIPGASLKSIKSMVIVAHFPGEGKKPPNFLRLKFPVSLVSIGSKKHFPGSFNVE
jgi:hypothetical protein